MVNIFLITGSLGAGKTTFLKNTLDTLKNKKVGVLINEFGQVGMDGTTIGSIGMKKVELNNGSIFCSCLKDSFIQGMADLIDSDLEYVFVESSGLADPSNITSILEIVRKLSKKCFNYKGAICLVDSLYFTKQIQVFVNLERQLKQSSLIILNKCDMQEEVKLNEITTKLTTINPQASIHKTSFGIIHPEIIENLKSSSKIINSESLNKEDNKPSVYTLKISPETTKEGIENFVKELMTYCSRTKGIIRIKDGLFQIESVMESFYINEVKNLAERELVVMSEIGFKIIKEINRLSKKYSIEFQINS